VSRPVLSIDTNVLLYAQNQDCPEHDAASAFLVECADRTDIAVCELVLMELYQLLRNPAVVTRPLDGPEAAEVCQTFRGNRRWALIENAPVINDVWVLAATPGIARRRLFDARTTLTTLASHACGIRSRRTTKCSGPQPDLRTPARSQIRTVAFSTFQAHDRRPGLKGFSSGPRGPVRVAAYPAEGQRSSAITFEKLSAWCSCTVKYVSPYLSRCLRSVSAMFRGVPVSTPGSLRNSSSERSGE
jgi:uncharacterized protein